MRQMKFMLFFLIIAVMHFVKCLSVLFTLTESYLIIVLCMHKFILGTVIGQDVSSGNSRSLHLDLNRGGVTCAMFHSVMLKVIL